MPPKKVAYKPTARKDDKDRKIYTKDGKDYVKRKKTDGTFKMTPVTKKKTVRKIMSMVGGAIDPLDFMKEHEQMVLIIDESATYPIYLRRRSDMKNKFFTRALIGPNQFGVILDDTDFNRLKKYFDKFDYNIKYPNGFPSLDTLNSLPPSWQITKQRKPVRDLSALKKTHTQTEFGARFGGGRRR